MLMRIGSSLSRRRFLKTATVAGAVGLAGCGTNASQPGARILGIEFLNLHNAKHEVEIKIVESGEMVLNDKAKLPHAEYDRGDLKKAITHDVRGVPSDSEKYVVRAWLDGDGPRVFRTSDRPESDCHYLRLFVTREAELVIATTIGCPEETPTET
jgi:hypothetical protein